MNIFARVVPEQKLRIVNALKANGEIVAMTGDGVNDAAALKSAHIGITMGGRGTDVAREASSIVLLDGDFSSIVQAIKMGRRIFDNLKKAMAYIFAIHVPIAGMSLFPVLFGWPLVLLLSVYVILLYRGQGELDARTLCFTTLIVANLGLILTNRSWSRSILSTFRLPNAALWWVLGGAALFLGTVLYLPFLKELFRFDTLHTTDLILCLSAGITSILWFEVFKIYRNRRAVA